MPVDNKFYSDTVHVNSFSTVDVRQRDRLIFTNFEVQFLAKLRVQKVYKLGSFCIAVATRRSIFFTRLRITRLIWIIRNGNISIGITLRMLFEVDIRVGAVVVDDKPDLLLAMFTVKFAD